ncbi:hypothetical protein ZYGR_0AS04320 [Zygosaccharomyces rouxii]|uniref:Bacterial surface antigen (D15) domain-containing protein n=1 Tax=Zygosaccharomyces rouxii TaxID=4956 RepID=A0A1Q3AH86_ZYGRO|nr:hypothetical protein ZYGR_0AS04320 [Zygosaccharomyces rouxii]
MTEAESDLVHNAHEQLDLHNNETKPLYISKIVLDGDNGSSPLSDSLCKAIFDEALTQPLQNVQNSINIFEDIRKKLLFTGLFSDVNITLDNDPDATSLSQLNKGISESYGIETPLSTQVKVLLKRPNYNTLSGTSTLSDDNISLAGSKSWKNLLGQADAENLGLGFNWNPVTNQWDGKDARFSFSLPLVKMPSVRAIVEAEGVNRDLCSRPFIAPEDEHSQQQYAVGAGFQKRWVCNISKSVPLLYTGVSVVRRNLNEFKPTASGLYAPFKGPFDKTSFVTSFTHDTRRHIGSFPLSGYQFQLNNEYVISQSQGASKQLPHGHNFNKTAFHLEHHASHWQDKITRSFQLQGGGIYPLGAEAQTVHPLDRFQLGGLNSLKGFHLNGVGTGGQNFFYKLGLNFSHKLSNTPTNAPLRLQYFFNLGNTSSDYKTVFNSYAAATGLSLVYKTPQALLDLTYAHPLTSRPQDLSKPGLSLGVSLTFF